MALEVSKTSAALLSFNPLDPIGSIFDGAMDSVQKTLDDTVQKTHDAVTDILMQAGGQAMRVIASLKESYIDSLQVTYDKADTLLKQNIDRVSDLVKIIASQEKAALLQVADKVETIVQLSPLSNYWIPLLKDTTPQFFAVDTDPSDPTKTWMTKVLVTFTGNFYYAAQAGCTPSFTLNGKKIDPISNTTRQLQFAIDVSSDDPTLSMNRYSYLKGELSMVWKSGWTPWSWVTSTYRTLLGALPKTPGTITVTYTTPATTTKKIVEKPPIKVNRNKDHWETHNGSYTSDPGWDVVGGSALIRWLEGPFSQCNASITSVEHNIVSYQYNMKNGSGLFQVVFDEQQPVPAVVRTQTIDTLKWGSSLMVAPNPGEQITKISFDAFDGSHAEFQPRTDETNPFIKLREFNGTIQISAAKASDLNSRSGAPAAMVASIAPKQPPRILHEYLVHIEKSDKVEKHSVTYKTDPGLDVDESFLTFGWPEGGPFDGDCGVTVKKIAHNEVQCDYYTGKGWGNLQVYIGQKWPKELTSSAPTSSIPKEEPVDLKKDD